MSDKYKGNIAAEAWDKTKTDSDPDFDAIPNIEFRQNLEYRASKVRETGVTLTNFEKEVANIIATQPKDDAPMAVVDASGINFAKAAEGQVKNEGANASEATSKPKTDNNPQPTDKEAPANDAAVKKLVKENNRAKLLKLAKKAGLDGNSYSNKNELAAAIVAAQKDEKPTKAGLLASKPGAPQGDQSGHVPDGEEAAAIVKEQANAPLHP